MWFYFGARTPAQAALFQTGWLVESLMTQTLIIGGVHDADVGGKAIFHRNRNVFAGFANQIHGKDFSCSSKLKDVTVFQA